MSIIVLIVDCIVSALVVVGIKRLQWSYCRRGPEVAVVVGVLKVAVVVGVLDVAVVVGVIEVAVVLGVLEVAVV